MLKEETRHRWSGRRRCQDTKVGQAGVALTRGAQKDARRKSGFVGSCSCLSRLVLRFVVQALTAILSLMARPMQTPRCWCRWRGGGKRFSNGRDGRHG